MGSAGFRVFVFMLTVSYILVQAANDVNEKGAGKTPPSSCFDSPVVLAPQYNCASYGSTICTSSEQMISRNREPLKSDAY